MKIAISGATGLIGSTLKAFFLKKGHEVSEISRQCEAKNHGSKILLDIKNKYIDIDALEGHDVIIHLSGANISEQQWSKAYKEEIQHSRLESTKLLVYAIQKMNWRPKVFLCASAVGYYGNHDSMLEVNEKFQAGKGFLPDVCKEWENSSADVISYGVRCVYMRFGMVLSRKGGALAKMLPAFYLGLGGRLGRGKQMMSWVVLNEIPNMVDFILSHDMIAGPVNFVSPNAVSNQEFTETLGKVIHRPTLCALPDFVVRMLFGEMGQTLLLEGCHAVPEVLTSAGYQFQYPYIQGAFEEVLQIH